jgi:hypothetical protein
VEARAHGRHPFSDAMCTARAQRGLHAPRASRRICVFFYPKARFRITHSSASHAKKHDVVQRPQSVSQQLLMCPTATTRASVRTPDHSFGPLVSVSLLRATETHTHLCWNTTYDFLCLPSYSTLLYVVFLDTRYCQDDDRLGSD